jgi:hypothetical protein
VLLKRERQAKYFFKHTYKNENLYQVYEKFTYREWNGEELMVQILKNIKKNYK